jgi:hypothetical protein
MAGRSSAPDDPRLALLGHRSRRDFAAFSLSGHGPAVVHDPIDRRWYAVGVGRKSSLG